MKKTSAFIFAAILCFTFFYQAAQAGNHTPAKGEAFPDIALVMPDKPCDMDYPGLKGKNNIYPPGNYRFSGTAS
jgi:hypothetical protein